MHTSESLQASFGYLFPGEVAALKQLAQSLPPNPVVVNLGAGSGTSGLAFMESRPDLTLWTIDIQREDSPFGCLYAERQVIGEAFPEVNLYSNKRFFQIEGDSKNVGLGWIKDDWSMGQDGFDKNLVNMVFVDADHSYNGCKDDILAWLPNIKPGGIMAVHDFEKKKVYARGNLPDKVPHPLPWPGVDRAVRHYLCGKYEIVLHVDTLISLRIK